MLYRAIILVFSDAIIVTANRFEVSALKCLKVKKASAHYTTWSL